MLCGSWAVDAQSEFQQTSRYFLTKLACWQQSSNYWGAFRLHASGNFPLMLNLRHVVKLFPLLLLSSLSVSGAQGVTDALAMPFPLFPDGAYLWSKEGSACEVFWFPEIFNQSSNLSSKLFRLMSGPPTALGKSLFGQLVLYKNVRTCFDAIFAQSASFSLALIFQVQTRKGPLSSQPWTPVQKTIFWRTPVGNPSQKTPNIEAYIVLQHPWST